MAAQLFYIPKTIPLDTTGNVMSGAKANFFITGTTTRQDTFTTEALTVAHANPVVADGNGVFAPIYLDDTKNYKLNLTDSLDVGLAGYPVDNLASNSTLVTDLASTANAKGASLIGLEDAAANFTATDVEAAIAEIIADLASTANALGASTVGVEDSAGNYTATEVEAVLAEIAPLLYGVKKFKAATLSRDTTITLADDPDLSGWALVTSKHYAVTAYLRYQQNVGDFKFAFQFSNTPVAVKHSITYWSTDQTKVQDNDLLPSMTAAVSITTMTDVDEVGLIINASFQANVTTGGTLDFQWAQDTSSGNSTSLFHLSWMIVTQLD